MKDEWIKQIKRNMVLMTGSTSTYKFKDKENRMVVIDLGAANLRVPPGKKDQPSVPKPAKGQRNISLDISSADFLVVNRHPSILTYRQLIPWKKIVDIVFQDDQSPLQPSADGMSS